MKTSALALWLMFTKRLRKRELYRLGLLTTVAFLAVFLLLGTPWVLFVTR